MQNVHRTTTEHGTIEYGESDDGTGLVVRALPTITDGCRRYIYPWSGGCWTISASGVIGRQLQGTCDIRVPRSPNRWRAFVRREHSA